MKKKLTKGQQKKLKNNRYQCEKIKKVHRENSTFEYISKLEFIVLVHMGYHNPFDFFKNAPETKNDFFIDFKDKDMHVEITTFYDYYGNNDTKEHVVKYEDVWNEIEKSTKAVQILYSENYKVFTRLIYPLNPDDWYNKLFDKVFNK